MDVRIIRKVFGSKFTQLICYQTFHSRESFQSWEELPGDVWLLPQTYHRTTGGDWKFTGILKIALITFCILQGYLKDTLHIYYYTITRAQQPESKAGDPGSLSQGLNTGVMLYHLDCLRDSMVIFFVKNDNILGLATRFFFRNLIHSWRRALLLNLCTSKWDIITFPEDPVYCCIPAAR